MRTVAVCTFALVALATPALADFYPVQGRWGVGQPSKQPVDCSNLRVIAFNGDQRTDSRGGVPAYRNVSVTPSSGGSRVVDEFNTGQDSGARDIHVAAGRSEQCRYESAARRVVEAAALQVTAFAVNSAR